MTDVERLKNLAADFQAVAAGVWRRDGDQLVQVCFVAGPSLATEVGSAFANATKVVPLTNRELGIVKAVIYGEVALSLAADLDPEVGSGFWLREFGAACSVAVSVAVGVVSLALVEVPADLAELVRRVRKDW